jgi:hypothetical protein
MWEFLLFLGVATFAREIDSGLKRSGAETVRSWYLQTSILR